MKNATTAMKTLSTTRRYIVKHLVICILRYPNHYHEKMPSRYESNQVFNNVYAKNVYRPPS